MIQDEFIIWLQQSLAWVQEAPCLLRVAAVFYSMGAMEGARTLVEEARCRMGSEFCRCSTRLKDFIFRNDPNDLLPFFACLCSDNLCCMSY